jgi:hypothetical protein
LMRSAEWREMVATERSTTNGSSSSGLRRLPLRRVQHCGERVARALD